MPNTNWTDIVDKTAELNATDEVVVRRPGVSGAPYEIVALLDVLTGAVSLAKVPDFSAAVGYEATQLVWESGLLYRAIAPVTAGVFSAPEWDVVSGGGAGLSAVVVPNHSVTETYVVDELTIISGSIYRAITNVPQGAFNASRWQLIVPAGTIISVNGQMPNTSGKLALTTAHVDPSTNRQYVSDADSNAIGNLPPDTVTALAAGVLVVNGVSPTSGSVVIDADNIAEGAGNKLLTVVERAQLSNAPADTNTALAAKADTSSLAAVATSGDYSDLVNTPTGGVGITGTNALAVAGGALVEEPSVLANVFSHFEVEVPDVENATNLALGWTVHDPSNITTQEVFLNDGVTLTSDAFVINDQQPLPGAWFGYDAGSAQQVTSLRYFDRADTIAYSMLEVVVEASNASDFSSLVGNQTFSVIPVPGRGHLLELSAPMTARYWRIRPTATINTTFFAVTELEVFNTMTTKRVINARDIVAPARRSNGNVEYQSLVTYAVNVFTYFVS